MIRLLSLCALLACALLTAGAAEITDRKLKRQADFWTFRTAERPNVPATKAASPIDAFIEAGWQKQNLHGSPPADRRTLARRIYFDLTGLPPTPEELQRFLGDKSPNACESLVNRLLNSKRYGERWARYWLDIVHFGESHGYDKDKPRPNAWPYRDYVIQAANNDVPYSRFVQEQLAGDVLFPDDPNATIATGFIAAGPWDFVGHVELPESKTDGLIARYNDRDDMVMTTMSTFLSLTVHCARCHDHKFDPIRAEDYYRLQAVFAGVDRADRLVETNAAIGQLRRDLKLEKQPLEKVRADLKGKAVESLSPEDAMSRELALKRIAEIEAELKKLPPERYVYAAAPQFKAEGSFKPAGKPRLVHLLRRGDVKQPVREVEPGALMCLPDLEPNLEYHDTEGSRRAALAKWLTQKENFLLRRSIVNRVWQFHFGKGLVDTPNDFGHMGGEPSHPELLDWLAYWFMDNGESLKELHKLIVTSAAYQQSSADNPDLAKIDGDNRYLWRMNRARLDAEQIRDTILCVSGQLDERMGGPSDQQFYFKDDHSPVYDYTRFDVDSPNARRRSIYRFIVRSVPDPLMDTLDCPDASLLTGKRNVTITALQALATLNNPFVLKQSEHLAARLQSERKTLAAQITRAYELALNRPPTKSEQKRFSSYAKAHGLPNACRVLFNSSEFMFID